VNLVYYGKERQLEYDFVVAPGADPRAIKLAFEGARQGEVNAQGEMVLRIKGGEVVMRRPLVYQEVNGKQQEIAGGYVLEGKQTRFHLGEYDLSKPLVIDPVLVYSTYLGGNTLDWLSGLAVDSAGNAYVTGRTKSTNFPTANPFQANYRDLFDIFVAKLNPSGSALVYSTYLGSRGVELEGKIAVDSSGSAYVTGGTTFIDFPTTPGAFDTECGRRRCDGGASDVFVTKLNPAGNGLIYSTYLGGVAIERGTGIAVDSQGNAYVTGVTDPIFVEHDFPVTPGAFDTKGHAFTDYFVTKLNPTGSALVYSTYLGGSGTEGLRINFQSYESRNVGVDGDIAIDVAGNAYVTGRTTSPDFPTTPGAYDTTCGVNPNCDEDRFGVGRSDVIVTKLNAAGSALLYSTFLGGRDSDFGLDIAVDSQGNAYVTGGLVSPDFPTTPGALNSGGNFVTKLDPSKIGAASRIYSARLGGIRGQGIAVDFQGNAYVAGEASEGFPLLNPLQDKFGGGSTDAVVIKLNPTGSAPIYSTYLGGSGYEEAPRIAVDTAGNVYVAGITSSTNFPLKNPAQPSFGGNEDSFIVKISDAGDQPPPPPDPATVRVENETKVCTPTDAYPRIAAQPAAGPNFPAIPEQPPTEIKCTFEAEVILDGISGNIGPVSLTIFDGFSPGLFFDRLTASNPTLKIASYTNNVLTFDPILLELPPQTVFQRFRISFEYFAFLNDLAEQRSPQQNCVTLRFTDPRTGRRIGETGGICADTGVLVPRLSLEKYASTTTGLPGDTLTFTVIALNGGNITLQFVDIDALIPNNTTLVPGSIDPPPTRVMGNRIEWRLLGPINPGSALPVNYSVTIDPNTPEGAKLVDQAFAQATTAIFPGAGTRKLNASSNQVSVMVMAVRTGIDLTLTTSPTAGCPLTTIDYNAKVTNTGQVTLDRLRLSLNQGTEPVAGNPTFPLQLEPLAPGESRTITYKGRIGLKQKGTLVDVATIVGRPVNNGVQVSELVGKVATATVQVLPPAISKITPASGAPGSSNLELKIEGACFVPETVLSFQSNSGIRVIDPTPPDFGFVGRSELRRRINIRADAVPGEREAFVTNPSGDSGGQRPFNVFTVTMSNNDLCSQATAITTLPFTEMLDARAATTSPDDPLQSCSSAGAAKNSNSVWYRFTPSQNGTVTVSTVGSNYDTILTAYTGACGSLREVACNDDFGSGVESQITFEVTAGITYLIEVTDFDDRPGGGMLLFTLRFTPR
jgi:uncharacterized repeat protein (TIGR01451 family)